MPSADIATLLAILRLLLAPRGIVEHAQRLVEHRAVIAAVVEIAGRDLVGKFFRPDEILAAEFDRIETELVDRRVHHPFDHEVGDLGAESTIGALLALVGQYRGNVQIDAADAIRPDDLRQRIAVVADAELEVRAVIVEHLAAQADHPVLAVERELGVVDAVRAMIVAGRDVIDAVLDVFDRPATDAGERGRENADLVGEQLAAEAAASDHRHQVDLVRRDAERQRHGPADVIVH